MQLIQKISNKFGTRISNKFDTRLVVNLVSPMKISNKAWKLLILNIFNLVIVNDKVVIKIK